MILRLPNRYNVPGLMPKVAREGIKERGGKRERKERKKGSEERSMGRQGRKGNRLTSNTLLLHIRGT